MLLPCLIETRADALQGQVDTLQVALRAMSTSIRTVACRHWAAGSCLIAIVEVPLGGTWTSYLCLLTKRVF